MVTKRCSRCGESKVLADFSPQRGQTLGVGAYCKPCNAAYYRERRSDPAVRAVLAAKQRERRRDPAVAAREQLTRAAWISRTGYRAVKTADQREAERVKARSPEGREANRLRQKKRTARLSGAEHDLTVEAWAEIVDRFNDRCAYCLADTDMEVEHMVPLSKGGGHTVANVVPACRLCNARKGTRDLVQSLAVL